MRGNTRRVSKIRSYKAEFILLKLIVAAIFCHRNKKNPCCQRDRLSLTARDDDEPIKCIQGASEIYSSNTTHLGIVMSEVKDGTFFCLVSISWKKTVEIIGREGDREREVAITITLIKKEKKKKKKNGGN